MGLTVIVNVCCADVSWPPLAVPPLSCTCTVTVALPKASDAVVNVRVPLGLIAGCTENRPLLSFVTMKLTVCNDSLVGPGDILVAQFGSVHEPLSSSTMTLLPFVNDGTSLTGLTVIVKVAVSGRYPSLTSTVTTEVPYQSGSGFISIYRFPSMLTPQLELVLPTMLKVRPASVVSLSKA